MSQELIEKKQQIIDSDGAWSAHNILLKDNIYTIDDRIINDEYKLQRVIQNISDFTRKDFSNLRILDLACLEGLFGIECARQGASVTLLDARDSNLRKVKFVTESLNLNNIKIVKDDVRNISQEKYGMFDVILCFGILYHLDKSDLYSFVKKMYDMTSNCVIFDTHITISKKEKFSVEETAFYGTSYIEHRSDATLDEKVNDLWKSIDNDISFYLTKESLVRMLNKIGFTSVTESYLPVDVTKTRFRITLTAHKGTKLKIHSAPLINNIVDEQIPEFSYIKAVIDKNIAIKNNIKYLIKMRSPRFLRNFYKKYLKNNRNYKPV
jgi:2-polyprenyl-3-methyl-5-hydroxy-6-metoxy-1,4-benzoquinol methylase